MVPLDEMQLYSQGGRAVNSPQHDYTKYSFLKVGGRLKRIPMNKGKLKSLPLTLPISQVKNSREVQSLLKGLFLSWV